MGVGLQIVCLGFAGAARIEAEAGAQLVRLERFSRYLRDCHLEVEMLSSTAGLEYDARLDLVTRPGDLVPITHCLSTDPEAAVRAAFEAAERELQQQASLDGD